MCETVQLGESCVSTWGPLVSHEKSLFVFVSVGPRTMCVKVTERDHVTPTAVPSHQAVLMMSSFGYLRFLQNAGILIPVQIFVLHRGCSPFYPFFYHFYSIT